MKNKYSGSSFDDFLIKEGIEPEVAARAAKRTFVHELKQKMAKKKANKSMFRRALKSPTTTERLFNDHTGISLETMSKAASVLDCALEIRLVPKSRRRAA